MGQLNPAEIETLLRTAVIGRIGCTEGRIVYIVPISYVYDGEYVYCHTHEGQKIDILRKNPFACFEVENLGDLANWQTVVAHGEFEELTDPDQRLAALEKLHQRRLPIIISQTTKLVDEWPFSSNQLADIKGVTFRIRLYTKSGRFEKAYRQTEVFF